jgi:thioredoxin 1
MKQWILTALALTAPFAYVEGQAPQPEFRVKGDQITKLRPGGEASLTIEVLMPEKTHIYVRHVSTLSFNILTTLWTAPDSGFRADVTAPDGKIKDQDYILEGRGAKPAGEFKLRLFETRGRPGSAAVLEVPLLIKTQMCNSQTNICYRPQELKRTLKVRVEGDRQVMPGERASSKIQWAGSYDQALQKARATGQNIFVLITAPSWCGYCKVLDRDVMSKESVAAVLNGKFVPLQVLDSSADLRRFSFDGYPTMMAYSPQGQKLAEVGALDEQRFLSSVRAYERAPSGQNDPAPSTTGSFSYTVSLRGTFQQNGNSWTGRTEGRPETETYAEERRDANFVVLKNSKTAEFLAVPLKGGQGFIYRDNRWVPYMQVTPGQ